MVFQSKKSLSRPKKNKLLKVLITDSEIIGFAKLVEVVAFSRQSHHTSELLLKK